MSDTGAMVNLMEHAAELLDFNSGNLGSRLTSTLSSDQIQTINGALVAMAYAEAVLRMVAASVAPEGRALAKRLANEYADWAEESSEIGMSDGELAAIARFLISASTRNGAPGA